MNFNSPIINVIGKNSDNSLGSNPFDTLSQNADSFNAVDMKKDPLYLSKCDIADCGRESLGILQIDLENIKFDDANWSNIPELRINNNLLQISTENLSDELNTAFLYSQKNSKLSVTSSAPTSTSSFPESFDFWELSEIKFPSSLISGTNLNSSTFNNAFINSGSNNVNTFDTAQKEKRNFTMEVLRARIQSLPAMLQTKDFEIEKISDKRLANPYLRNFRKSESLLKRSFMSPPLLKANEAEDKEFVSISIML